MSDTPLTDALCKQRNFSPYREPASGQGTVASELAFLAMRFERELGELRTLSETQRSAAEAWYAVKDSDSYSSVRYKAVLQESIGEQEIWVAHNLAHHHAQQIADDHNRALRPSGDWYRRKIEQTGEEPHAIGPLSAGVERSPGANIRLDYCTTPTNEWVKQRAAELSNATPQVPDTARSGEEPMSSSPARVAPSIAAHTAAQEVKDRLHFFNISDENRRWIHRAIDDLAALASSPPSASGERCPDCKREKAHSANDVLAGKCPKWWAIRDKEADRDCERVARG